MKYAHTFVSIYSDRVRYVPEWGMKGWVVLDRGTWVHDPDRIRTIEFAKSVDGMGSYFGIEAMLRAVRRSGLLDSSPDDIPTLSDPRVRPLKPEVAP